MKLPSLFARIAAVLLVACSMVAAQDKEIKSEADSIKGLAKEASACRRKAMDYRVMSINAMKNAEAVRGDAHKALVAAMMSGSSENISKAKDALDNAADDLEDVIKEVQKAVEFSMKAEMDAREAEERCKGPDSEKTGDGKGEKEKIESLLDSSAKQIAKAESIAEKLRKAWLEPFFSSTTTTSTTTSTTRAMPLTPGK